MGAWAAVEFGVAGSPTDVSCAGVEAHADARGVGNASAVPCRCG